MFEDAEVIYTYTTQDAINDGTHMDARAHLQLGFATDLYIRKNWRVILTVGVLDKLEKAAAAEQDDLGIVWGRFLHCYTRAIKERDPDGPNNFLTFEVKVAGQPVTIWVGSGPFGPDDDTPTLTFYLPEEY